MQKKNNTAGACIDSLRDSKSPCTCRPPCQQNTLPNIELPYGVLYIFLALCRLYLSHLFYMHVPLKPTMRSEWNSNILWIQKEQFFNNLQHYSLAWLSVLYDMIKLHSCLFVIHYTWFDSVAIATNRLLNNCWVTQHICLLLTVILN